MFLLICKSLVCVGSHSTKLFLYSFVR